ncbi:hypothetical protein TUMSATVNIG1_07160 [Vibrio nigripulchritudo]|uniref:zinc ribbon-containing protein n=1 Tax=Vibrio nigripulchritudo TaxID=28173 RepID=UPI00190C1539|nr:zinc ribbon-containing protein [Vibrio nigripulchritudo]BCL68776.1 hypothetical protein VNTUMSATTG_07130 [Vibrio nigripulchritudo]BDU30107.1 hypothetical protein TUMSATVNIG1_07160 [Vibrio nigripulchritudo]
MPEHKARYEAFFEEVVDTLKHTPEELERVLETSTEVMSAASDMTKDELSLVSAYVRSDLNEFAQNYQHSKETFPDSPFYRLIADSVWEGLLDITDRTKVEWQELFMDLEHKGLYQTGEVIGLGYLVCDKCGHKTYFNHATVIPPCQKCGYKGFTRQALKP